MELPEKQRAALLLKVNQGLSYREIGKVLAVSVASVESLIFRARSRLKQLVGASMRIPLLRVGGSWLRFKNIRQTADWQDVRSTEWNVARREE
jgi:predicted RNA polymerase sigma factor